LRLLEQNLTLLNRSGVHGSTCRLTSPDLNPIELSFATLKSHLRKAGKRAILAIFDQIGKAITRFAPIECRGYFKKAGYAST
jgi:transposase